MHHQKILSLFLSITVLLCANARGQNREDARIARLAGLAKVWGTVKYFHPYLADREIDWDKALIETIPKVNTANTSQEYQAALNHMLAVLDDKCTRAELVTDAKPAAPTPPASANPVRIENGVLFIDATQIAQAATENISALNGFVANINQSLPNARSVIIDVRSTRKPTELEAYHFDNFIRQTLPTMLDKTVVLGATRYRMHNGYATQTGGGYNSYYSAIVNSAPKSIAGRSKTKTPPLAFIINENSPAFADILSGMQSAGRALIVQEGGAPNVETFTFEAATDVTFIGMPTAGANGDVTFMVLPGNLTVSFSGHDVRHADGRQLQRVGIQPTIKVAPTIRGLIDGRDEILEEAVRFLQKKGSE